MTELTTNTENVTTLWELVRTQLFPSLRRTLVPILVALIVRAVGSDYIDTALITDAVAALLAATQYGIIRFVEIKAGGAVPASILIGGRSAPSYSDSHTGAFTAAIGQFSKSAK